MIEQRSMKRFKLRLPVLINHCEPELEHPPMVLSTTNVCAGGAYLQTDNPLPLESKVIMNVVLPFKFQADGSRSSVKIGGSTIRVNDIGMAIAFDKAYSIWPIPADQLETDRSTFDTST
jgi:hypothetical protein